MSFVTKMLHLFLFFSWHSEYLVIIIHVGMRKKYNHIFQNPKAFIFTLRDWALGLRYCFFIKRKILFGIASDFPCYSILNLKRILIKGSNSNTQSHQFWKWHLKKDLSSFFQPSISKIYNCFLVTWTVVSHLIG